MRLGVARLDRGRLALTLGEANDAAGDASALALTHDGGTALRGGELGLVEVVLALVQDHGDR